MDRRTEEPKATTLERSEDTIRTNRQSNAARSAIEPYPSRLSMTYWTLSQGDLRNLFHSETGWGAFRTLFLGYARNRFYLKVADSRQGLLSG